MTIEIWKSVVGYEGLYEVSNAGRVRSLNRMDLVGRMRNGKVLRPGTSTRGYFQVALYRGGGKKSLPVHRLVLTAFVGECPIGSECLHGDGNRKNAAIGNLKWGTRQENCADRSRHGTAARGMRSGVSKLTEDQVREILSDTRTLVSIAADYPVTFSTIARIKTGETWAHIGRNE